MAKHKDIDWDTVEKLCSIQCTGEEIAAIVGVDYDTLNAAIKRVKKCSFSDYFKKHSATGRASLRRTQFKVAVEDKHPTMLIWLGKQHLGQKEPERNNGELGDDVPQTPVNIKVEVVDARKPESK